MSLMMKRQNHLYNLVVIDYKRYMSLANVMIEPIWKFGTVVFVKAE
jgi:hypothetical protein